MPIAQPSPKLRPLFLTLFILVSLALAFVFVKGSVSAAPSVLMSREQSHIFDGRVELTSTPRLAENMPRASANSTPGTCVPAGIVVPSPSFGENGSTLTAITAVSADNLWAVGSYIDPNYMRKTLIEHWNGSNWLIVPSPNPDSYNSYLYGVSAVSANDIWTVGNHGDATNSHQTLIEHWDGSNWSIVPSPNGPGYDNYLAGVSVVSANDVWAVGSSSMFQQTYQTLVEHWDGITWSIIPSPNPAGPGGLLEGVSAVSANDVWAVGIDYSTGSGVQTLIEHWDGALWSIIPCPNLWSHSELLAVTAIAPGDAWAVGNFQNPNTQNESTLVEHWDGVSWSVIASPDPDILYNRLYSVSAVSTNDVWAVGSYLNSNGAYPTLVEHWDGSTWSIVWSPNPSGQQDELWGVVAVPAREAWTVGFTSTAGGTRTLVEHFQDCLPIPTATATPQPPPCPSERFTDVCPQDYFYEAVLALNDDGILSGYNTSPPCLSLSWIPCFKPYNSSTRGQVSKVVSLAAGFNEPVSGQSFQDVPSGSTFYAYIQRMASRGIINGYPCGGAGEPCVPPENRAYFRTNNNVTRGQLSKMVASAFGWSEPVTGQQFEDVAPGSAFYDYVGRLVNRNIINGYACGGAGEPCVPPANRPYFRPNNSVTRGQTAKIVHLARPLPTPTPTVTLVVISTPTPSNATSTETPTNPDCQGIPASQYMQISPGDCEPAGTTFTFVGSGFQPHELISTYMTAPDGSIFGAPFQIEADDNGIASGVTFHTTSTFPTGDWYLTMEGVTSQHQAIGYFRLLSP